MPSVEVEISRLVDVAQPGWVECRLIDTSGKSHVFIEKIPVVSAENLWTDSIYPARGGISCRVVARRSENGRTICTVDTERPYDIESTEGATRFDVDSDQLESEILACPRCGCDLIIQATGESRCVSSGALLSVNVTKALRERFAGPMSTRDVARSTFRTDGEWFCPACGVSMRNSGDRVFCTVCGQSLHDLVWELLELNPHP